MLRENSNVTIYMSRPFLLLFWTKQLSDFQAQIQRYDLIWGCLNCDLGQNSFYTSGHKFNVTIWFGCCFRGDLGQNSSYTSSHKFNVTIWFWGCFDCDFGQNRSYTVNPNFNVTIWFWAVLDTKIANRNVERFSLTKTIFDSLKTSIQRYDLLFVS